MNTEQLRIVSLFLLAMFFALYFYTDNQQDYFDQNARPQAERMVQIISRWNKADLLSQLSDDARQTLSNEQLDKLLEHYRQFGELKSVGELQFSKLVSALSLFGSQRINYKGTATYSSGPANINMTLVPDGGGYKIYNFTISR